MFMRTVTYIEIWGMQLKSTQGKLIAFNIYIRKEKLQINLLGIHLKTSTPRKEILRNIKYLMK